MKVLKKDPNHKFKALPSVRKYLLLTDSLGLALTLHYALEEEHRTESREIEVGSFKLLLNLPVARLPHGFHNNSGIWRLCYSLHSSLMDVRAATVKQARTMPRAPVLLPASRLTRGSQHCNIIAHYWKRSLKYSNLSELFQTGLVCRDQDREENLISRIEVEYSYTYPIFMFSLLPATILSLHTWH